MVFAHHNADVSQILIDSASTRVTSAQRGPARHGQTPTTYGTPAIETMLRVYFLSKQCLVCRWIVRVGLQRLQCPWKENCTSQSFLAFLISASRFVKIECLPAFAVFLFAFASLLILALLRMSRKYNSSSMTVSPHSLCCFTPLHIRHMLPTSQSLHRPYVSHHLSILLHHSTFSRLLELFLVSVVSEVVR